MGSTIFSLCSQLKSLGRTPSEAILEPSNYMQKLTRYLSNIMNSTLLGLPREVKELIYFDTLSHAANKVLVCHEMRDLFTSLVNSLLIRISGTSPVI